MARRYATGFLIRAKEHGRNVPDFAVKAALGWLRDYVRQDHTIPQELPAVAYAYYVLARGQAGDIPTLRYFNDTQLSKLPTQLAVAQLGAALAQAGDATRANAAYAAAFGAPPRRPAGLRYADFGSELRDSAVVLAFSAGKSGQNAASDRGDGPGDGIVHARQPDQHAGAGLAFDGGRGDGARKRRHNDNRDRRCGGANQRQAGLSAPQAFIRRTDRSWPGSGKTCRSKPPAEAGKYAGWSTAGRWQSKNQGEQKGASRTEPVSGAPEVWVLSA